ncbi:AraC family transcriptional regulator [Spongiibacter sp.]|uniref:AraC family transcriptional regulator n=1 Tax=Spongiibacter sp. TaxID=2024860 RepID=UPI00356B006F
MQNWDFCRSVMSTQLLVTLGTEYGATPSAMLRNSGLSEASLSNPETLVEAQSELSVIRNLLRELPPIDGLGLIAGKRYQLSAYGIWGFAIASSPTARKAIELAQTYQQLTFAFASFNIDISGDRTRILFDDRDVPEDVRLFCLEREMAAAAVIIGELLGSHCSAPRVYFRHPAPHYAKCYQQHFGHAVAFNADCNALEFSSALLDLPRSVGNESTANLLAKQCGELLASRSARRGLSGKVRDLLLRQRPMQMDMEAVAASLHMTSRTLRRKLEAEGSSFRQLSDEIRVTLAEELLRGTPLSIEQIAERLSYADASSFSQAFKRMTKQTPGAFRRAEQRR